MNLYYRKEPANRLRVTCMVVVICVFTTLAAHAQLSEIYQLPNTLVLGNDPQYVTLIQATDGNFYGTTYGGGVDAETCSNYVLCGGTIFKITSSGSFTSLYTFCSSTGCPDGRSPQAGLVQANDGNFYGTTYAGGTNNQGTIFRFTPQGALTTLHSFCDPPNTCSPNDGAGPVGTLIQASNGALFGTTNAGTLFKITLKGVFSLLYTFPGTSINASLLQAPNGTVYGATYTGGAYAHGSIFKTTLTGKVTTLYSFCSGGGSCADGSEPNGGLALGTDGNLYGTTFVGGTDGLGTVFKLTPKGKLTTLHVFTGTVNGGQDGANPEGPMVLGTDGNLYGTTYNGGTAGGTIFQITSSGAYSQMAELGPSCTGGHTAGGLLQSTNGNFYGLDQGFECASAATFFEYNAGLGPFVTTTPGSGKPGAKIVIEGTDLTGATGVKFNGTAATFTVVSASEITAVVPTGATSGKVDVTTPSGTLASYVSFTVK